MNALHPRVRIVWALRAVVLALVAGAVVVAVDRAFLGVGPRLAAVVAATVAVVGAALAALRYRRWRFSLDDDALELRRGVLTHVETTVPYVRVQHVDTRRGPVERGVGLARVVVYTAGSRGADVTVPGLSPDRARDLRDALRDRAIESTEGDAV